MPIQHDAPTIKENADGTIAFKYIPKHGGMHELALQHGGKHVKGSPFQFHVDNSTDGHVTTFGSGLAYGTAAEPVHFTVNANDTSHLKVDVNGPAKAEIKLHDNKDGSCAVTWIPPAPGEYKVHIKMGGREIAGSPFTARISGEGRKRAHVSLGSTSEVSLKISEEVKGLSSSIKSPTGIEEPCAIRKIDQNHLGISFTPREHGDHLVYVKKKGTLLPNAPFKIKVDPASVGNPKKVKATGGGVEQAQTMKEATFVLDTRGAGYGGCSISIEGPSRCEIDVKDNKDGTSKVSYVPTEPGLYVLSVKFADSHVPGSPFTVSCMGAGVGVVESKIKQILKPPKVAIEGSEVKVNIAVPDTSQMDMRAKINTPSGKTEDVELKRTGGREGTYQLRFTPHELGQHIISLTHQDVFVAGSPFHFTVGDIKEGGSHKVKASGPGVVRGEINFQNIANIYSREASTGELEVKVEGPAKAAIEYVDLGDSNGYVKWSTLKTGDYNVSIKFNGNHIPDSPFKVFISPPAVEVRKLEVASFPDSNIPRDKPVTFNLLTNGAKGKIDAKAFAPSGAEDDCFITPIDDDVYAVRFIPQEQGNHYVHIKLDGVHMINSPFRVRVGGRDETDPTAVTVTGDGIKAGETGKKCEFILNTCNAGAGVLAVTCDGPSKVTMDAYEVDVGYKVRYTPMAPGEYFFTVKFNGIHVPGSPYKLKVSGKTLGGSGYNESSSVQIHAVAKSGKGLSVTDIPQFRSEHEKVTCKGMGLKKAYMGRQNMFTVDASQAGSDMLNVTHCTEKGPGDEVYIKHMGRGNYTVNYVVREKGVVFLFVKYGDKHIPGSPFLVEPA